MWSSPGKISQCLRNEFLGKSSVFMSAGLSTVSIRARGIDQSFMRPSRYHRAQSPAVMLGFAQYLARVGLSDASVVVLEDS